jgi:hypothetical protein
MPTRKSTLASSAAGGSDSFGWVRPRLSRASAAHRGRPRTYMNETTSETKRSQGMQPCSRDRREQQTRPDGRVAFFRYLLRIHPVDSGSSILAIGLLHAFNAARR